MVGFWQFEKNPEGWNIYTMFKPTTDVMFSGQSFAILPIFFCVKRLRDFLCEEVA